MECDFDPAKLPCQGADSDQCLTPAEVATANAFYSGPTNHAGKATYYGWPPGSETGVLTWAFLQTPLNTPGEPSFDGLFKWVFGPEWNWRNFDLDRDMPQVGAKLGPIVNGAVTGDFTQFKARGGKLIMFQGWADPIVSPYQTVVLYEKLTQEFGPDQDFARLFMAPGLTHCGLGGTGLFPIRAIEHAASAIGRCAPRPVRGTQRLGRRQENPDRGRRHQLSGQQRPFEGNSDAAAALPLSAEGLVQGRRRSERRQQLCLREQATLTDARLRK
jgi:hypothetical protein